MHHFHAFYTSFSFFIGLKTPWCLMNNESTPSITQPKIKMKNYEFGCFYSSFALFKKPSSPKPLGPLYGFIVVGLLSLMASAQAGPQENLYHQQPLENYVFAPAVLTGAVITAHPTLISRPLAFLPQTSISSSATLQIWNRLKLHRGLVPLIALVSSGVVLARRWWLEEQMMLHLSTDPDSTKLFQTDLINDHSQKPDPHAKLVPVQFTQDEPTPARPDQGEWTEGEFIASSIKPLDDADIFFKDPRKAEDMIHRVHLMSNEQIQKRMAQLTILGEQVFVGPSLDFWNRRHLYSFMAQGWNHALESHIFLGEIMGGQSIDFAPLYSQTPRAIQTIRHEIINRLKDYQLMSDLAGIQKTQPPADENITLDSYMKGFKSYQESLSESSLDEILARLHPDHIPSWSLFQNILAKQKWFRLEVPRSVQVTAEQYRLFVREVLDTPMLKHLFCSRILGITSRLTDKELSQIHKVGQHDIVKAHQYLKLQLFHIMAEMDGPELSELTQNTHHSILFRESELYLDLLAWKALSPKAWVDQISQKIHMNFDLTPEEMKQFHDLARDMEFEGLESRKDRADYLSFRSDDNQNNHIAKEAQKWQLRPRTIRLTNHNIYDHVMTFVSLSFEAMNMTQLAHQVRHIHHQQKIDRLEQYQAAQKNRAVWLTELQSLFHHLRVEDTHHIMKEDFEDHSIYQIFDSQGYVWFIAEVPDSYDGDVYDEVVADVNQSTENPFDDGEHEFTRFKVVAYVNASTEDPGSQVGGWAASMIFGEHLTVRIRGSTGPTDQRRVEILAIQEALRYTHNDDIVEIHIPSDNILNIFKEEQWLNKWDTDGRITSNHPAVANQDLLVPLVNMVQSHFIHFVVIEDQQVHFGNQMDAWEAREMKIRFLPSL